MKRLSRPRRSLWLVLGLVIGVLATAATMAVAGLQPADLNFTPRTEAQTTNVDVARAWAKNYYGAHSAVAGPNGTWYTPLNLDSNYANEARSVADQSDHWLSARRHVPHRAIVLDVDDTTLTTWNYELYSNWDFNPTTNAQFVGITNGAFSGNMFPPTPGMLDLASHAKALGYGIFWITGRGDSQHAATIANLVDDSAAGLPDIDEVTLNGHTIPEVDAGYPLPTPIDTGHGGFTDGLFTKPPLGLVPGLSRQAGVLRAVHRSGHLLPDRPVQVRDARVHRVAGLRHRRRLGRPVQRSPGRLRGQDVQDAEPELLPPLGEVEELDQEQSRSPSWHVSEGERRLRQVSSKRRTLPASNPA